MPRPRWLLGALTVALGTAVACALGQEAGPLRLSDCKVTVLGQTTADPVTIQRGETRSKENPAAGWEFAILTVKIEKPRATALYVNSRDFVLAYERADETGEVLERHEGCIAIERLGEAAPKEFAPGVLQGREDFFAPIGFADDKPTSQVMHLRLAFHIHEGTAKAQLCTMAPCAPVALEAKPANAGA
jgi:hypothetical protein